ncbi:MAG: hypothetical protein WDN08_01310 [Rhizomicrobium sp.]
MNKIAVRRQHHQIVPDAQLRQQRVDGSDPHTIATAMIAQLCRVDVIGPVRRQIPKRREPIQYPLMRLGA